MKLILYSCETVVSWYISKYYFQTGTNLIPIFRELSCISFVNIAEAAIGWEIEPISCCLPRAPLFIIRP